METTTVCVLLTILTAQQLGREYRWPVAYLERGPAPAAKIEELDGIPRDSQFFARAKREARYARLDRSAHEKVELLYWAYYSRRREFLAGRGTLDLCLAGTIRLRNAELAVAANVNERLAAYERCWFYNKEILDVNEARSKAGRIPIQDLLQSKHGFFGATIELVQASKAKGGPFQPVGTALPPYIEMSLQSLAQAKAMIAKADLAVLSESRAAAARGACEARFREFLERRGTLDILLEAALQWLDSERAVYGNKADPIAFATRRIQLMALIDAENHERYQDVRIPIQDYLESHFYLQDAELELLDARAAASRQASPESGIGPRAPHFLTESDLRPVAKVLWEATRADRAGLLQARAKSAHGEWVARRQEFLAGRGTLDNVLHASLRRLYAELARHDRQADHVVAFETNWVFMREAEEINRARTEAGRIPTKEYFETRYYRLEAEQWLAEARAGKEPKLDLLRSP
jgi:hypothetical protein